MGAGAVMFALYSPMHSLFHASFLSTLIPTVMLTCLTLEGLVNELPSSPP